MKVKRPGVYIEEISKFPHSVAAVETAIPAFIGYTEKAVKSNGETLLMTPHRITSMLDFESFFGRAKPETTIGVTVEETKVVSGIKRTVKVTQPTKRNPFLMYYSMQLYFANGGGPCWIVSVGCYGNDLPENEKTVNRITNTKALKAGLDEIAKIDEPTLLIFPDNTKVEEIDAATFYGLYNDALMQCNNLRDRFTIIDTLSCEDSTTDPNIVALRDNILSEKDFLQYGAAYYPHVETILDYVIDENEIIIESNGLLDGKPLAKVENLDNSTYYKIKASISKLPIELPPSSAIAGVYVATDERRGVWKAPANVSLNYVINPTASITDDMQADMNTHSTGKSINAIRWFTGRGTLVWGARTLAGNDNEWRYVPVRRFFSFVEESVKKSIEAFVFEPNDDNTWKNVKAMIENFLTLQWRSGALVGAKTEQAFYVKVGLGQTMTAQDILEGKMIVEIGMAAVRPAEFIVLKLTQQMEDS